MRIAACITLFAAVVAASGPAAGQSGGPDASGNSFFTTTYDYVPLAAIGTDLNTGNAGEVTVSLPWAFPWYGGSFTDIRVGANGGIRFGSSGEVTAGNNCLPATGSDAPDLAPLWDDLNPGTAGAVYGWYDTAADRQIISWEGVQSGQSTGTGSFQVHLLPNGEVEFHYADLDFGEAAYSLGTSATVGVQDHAGGTASSGNLLQVSCNDGTQISDGLAIVFSSCVDADADGERSQACGGADCDDSNSSVLPGAAEICNGTDDDCDASTDETIDGDGDGVSVCAGDCDDSDGANVPAGTEVCDGADNDCAGGADFPGELVDADVDGALSCNDCDDADPGIFPGASEVCDGVDNDCDGAVPTDEVADADADGWVDCADCAPSVAAINPGAVDTCDGVDANCDGQPEPDDDGDGVLACDGDCDDGDSTVLPSAPELCDGLDNDCDGALPTDEEDADTDGAMVCDGDCDDGDAATFPGATEICDALDNDCDGLVPADEVDLDGDGWIACADCDDSAPSTWPGAVELCNGVDDDCDGNLGTVFHPDPAADGTTGAWRMRGHKVLMDSTVTLGTMQFLLGGGSGTAMNFLVYESTTESGQFTQIANESMTTVQGGTAWRTSPPLDVELTAGSWYLLIAYWYGFAGYGYTENAAMPIALGSGYGEIVAGVSQNLIWSPPTVPSASMNDTGYELRLLFQDEVDSDSDGSPVCEDCDDDDPNVSPYAVELCNGEDETCDGIVPPDEADDDGDGYRGCDGDCDDDDGALNPGATEVCDGIDNDCDPTTDEDDDREVDSDVDTRLSSADSDHDDRENHPGKPEVCDGRDNDCDGVPNADLDGEVDADLDGSLSCFDCDDDDPSVYVGAPELCDDLDNDCDPATDEDFDLDEDGYSACDGDCLEGDATIYPGAVEICNAVDDDCDGLTDEEACSGGDDDDSADMAALTPVGCQSECDGAGIRFGGLGPFALLAGLFGFGLRRRIRRLD